jgi:hypothetical protein
MAGDAPVIRGPDDIRNLTAKFRTDRGSHFAVIRGRDGFITAAAGAKVAIFSRWRIEHSGNKPDGTPRHRFRGQFSWVNEPLMNMVTSGKLKGRVILQGKFKNGAENVDILGWAEWRMENGVLTLEDIYQVEGVKFRPIDDTR